MRVLWLSVTPSLYDEQKIGGWIASLESIFQKYLFDKVQLGIAFEYKESKFKVEKNGVTYYPFLPENSLLDKLTNKVSINNRWKTIKPCLLKIINDFKPDIIHCFGTEWSYGAISSFISIPVIIHMQGFMNIYDPMSLISFSFRDRILASKFSPKSIIKCIVDSIRMKNEMAFEKSIMKNCRYYMGRTEWDKNIVKYYSKNATYYHVPEAIRHDIYDSTKKWNYKHNKKIRIITISQAGYLKGNEFILRTADVLRSLMGLDFEWRVAGRKDSFRQFEKKTGISASSVNVKLLGMIGSDQIIDELADADFYVHPAIIDNSPNSLCEAQLIGCPVITTDVGGIPQLVEDGNTGFLVPYNEPHTLAFKICNLVGNQELLSRVSINEIEISHKRHSPITIANTVYDTYQTTLLNDNMQIIKGTV